MVSVSGGGLNEIDDQHTRPGGAAAANLKQLDGSKNAMFR